MQANHLSRAILLPALLLTMVGSASAQFPGVTLYGTATPGCAGTAAIGTNSTPAIGNPTFAITCTGAMPLAPGLMILGVAQKVPPVAFGNINLWVDTVGAVARFVTMTLGGSATVGQPIPAIPAFVGSNWYAQFGWVDPGPGCPAGSSLLASTQALQFSLQGCGPDPGEPNNSAATATAIAAPTTLSRILCPNGDEDWFSFTVPAGQKRILAASMTPPGGLNYDFELQSATAVLATRTTGGSAIESITNLCLGGGTYFLRVYGPGACDPVNAYTLSLALGVYTPGGTLTTTGSATMTSSNWHPSLQNMNYPGPGGPCSETIRVTITGTHTLTGGGACGSPTASIEWYNQNQPFPQTLASTVLGPSGSYSLTATFQAPPGSAFGFGLFVSGPTPFCQATVGGTMTVTRQ